MLSAENFYKEDEDFISGIAFNGFYKNIDIRGEESDLIMASFYVRTSHNRIINLCCMFNAIKPNTVIDIFPDMVYKNSPSSLTDHVYIMNSDVFESDRVDAYSYYTNAIQLFVAPDKIRKIKLYLRKEHFHLIGYISDCIKLGLKISNKFVYRLETFENPLDVEKLDISNRKILTYSILNTPNDVYNSALYLLYDLPDSCIMEHRHFNCDSRKQRKKIVKFMKDKYNLKELKFKDFNTSFMANSIINKYTVDSDTKFTYWYVTKDGQTEFSTYYPSTIIDDSSHKVKYKYLEINSQDFADIDGDFKEIIEGCSDVQ